MAMNVTVDLGTYTGFLQAATQIHSDDLNGANTPSQPTLISPHSLSHEVMQPVQAGASLLVPAQSFTVMTFSR